MVEEFLTAVAGLPTTGSIDTPIGTLEISNGYPTEVTTRKLFDEMGTPARGSGLSLGATDDRLGAMAERAA